MYTLRRSRSSASQCPTVLQKKLLLLGDSNSGKTYLLYRRRHNKYPNNQHDIMMNDSIDQYEKFEDSYRVMLMLVDTNNFYDRLFSLYCVSTDVILMCFAIDSHDSLERVVNYWKPEIIDKHCKDVPIILVGTKMDLRNDNKQKTIIITREEAMRVAELIGAVMYLECSAKLNDGNGVREVFDAAVNVIVGSIKGLKADRRKSKCVIS